MGRAIIHFGMHKTGSSSIQRSLSERLSDPSFRYVKVGAPNSSGSIAIGFLDDPADYQGSRKAGLSVSELERRRQNIRAKLSVELQKDQARQATVILSAEYISSMKAPDFRGLCDFFVKHDYAVTAVGYIRSPKAFMESAFQQRLQGGFKAFDVSKLYPDYRRNFEKFEAVLGKDQVQLWHFDPEAFPGGCVVQDFCRRLGIQFRPEDVIRVNEGLSLPAVSLLYAYRKLGAGYGVGPTVIRENSLLNQRMAQLRGPKLRFHSSLVAPLIEAERDDIAWMEARLGTSMSEDLTRDDDCAIRSEEDLLTFAPETLQWLAEQLGPDYVDRWRPGMTAQEVADWMHALRVKLSREDAWVQRKRPKVTPIKRSGGEMNISELVQHAKRASPELLQEMPDDAAAALLREVFTQICQHIQATDEGVVKVAGLGQFRVRQMEGSGDGAKATVKRTLFKARVNLPFR